MRMILCCGDQGLLTFDGQWHRLPCPLRSPSLICIDPGAITAVDTQHAELWSHHRVLPISRGAEALLCMPGQALVLSGETDCLMRHDAHTGQLLITAPMGVEPQDMCLLHARLLAVCGGGDGALRLVSLPGLQQIGSIPLTGCVQRVACSGGRLYALCAAHGYDLHTLLYRIGADGRAACLMRLPGLPGALCADGDGGVWAASSETLVRIHGRTRAVLRRIGGTGLIRHMVCSGGWLLTSDPVLGVCRLYAADGRPVTECHGDAGQALLVET